jgi:hypothetical protein
MERLTEIDDILNKNKELQEDIVKKIEESRAMLNGAEVKMDVKFQHNKLELVVELSQKITYNDNL